MTNNEIALMKLDYASKSKYNSDMAMHEVRDNIFSTVIAVVDLAFVMPKQGISFEFGMNHRVTTLFGKLKTNISEMLERRLGMSMSISARLCKRLEMYNDWKKPKPHTKQLATHVLRLKYELEAFIAVGMGKGLNQPQIVEWFMSNLENPHLDIEIETSRCTSVLSGGILRMVIGGIKSAYGSIGGLVEDVLV